MSAAAAASGASTFPPKLETVQIEVKGNYAIVTLNRPPVNGMNLTVWSDLLSALDALEKQKSIRGAVFASGLAKDIFTAGNDLRELYAKSTNEQRYTQFWMAQQTFLTRLYMSRLATVAAIRGACPAGGCIFALCCDYRLMTNDVPNASIGLNEVALGIPVPRFWVTRFLEALGSTRGELALLSGRMLTPEQAQQGGLLHQLVPKDNLMAEAEKALNTLFLRHPDAGRIGTKRDARAALAKQWIEYAPQEAAGGWKMLSAPQTVAALGQVMQKLSGAKPQAKL